MTQLIVNGKPYALRNRGSVGDLLRELGAAPDRVALMVNDRIVRRESWSKVQLQDGDRLEVLTFAGGG